MMNFNLNIPPNNLTASFINNQKSSNQNQFIGNSMSLAPRFTGLSNANSSMIKSNFSNNHMENSSSNINQLNVNSQQSLNSTRPNLASAPNFNFNLQHNFMNGLNYPLNQVASTNNLYQVNGNIGHSLIASVLAANNASAFVTNNHANSANGNGTFSLNNTLFVGNLHASLQEVDLIQVFRPFGRIVECCKKWLHFGFVKFTTEEEACHAYVTLNGFRLKGRPMRLEFQNRTKKARIKALLAQAAFQSTNNSHPLNNCNDNNFDISYGDFNNFLYDDRNQVHQHQQTSHLPYVQNVNQTINNQTSLYKNATETESIEKSFDSNMNLFNPEQLIKFASGFENTKTENLTDLEKTLSNDLFKNYLIEINYEEKSAQFDNEFIELDMGTKNSLNSEIQINTSLANKNSNSEESMLSNLLKRALSPTLSSSISPSERSCSLSVSSADSGCRSTSFIADEDSQTNNQFLKIPNSKSKIEFKFVDDCNSVSEHMEFTCSNNCSPIKLTKKIILQKYDDSDVEDENVEDDIFDHHSDTSDDASDLQSECPNEDIDAIVDDNEYYSESLTDKENEQIDKLIEYKQIIENDGSIIRKKLEFGNVYRSINQTYSLFIEPNDILKELNVQDYKEYNLFPNGTHDMINDSYMIVKHNIYAI